MKYRTTILQTGGNTTGIPVPDDVVAALGAGRRPPVTVTVRGHVYRSTVATMNGQAMVSLSAENRAAAGVAGGDQVEVEVVLDTAPRTVEVPPDLAEALAAAVATEAFAKLAPSHQKAHVLSVNEAKTEETRRRRIEKVVNALA